MLSTNTNIAAMFFLILRNRSEIIVGVVKRGRKQHASVYWTNTNWSFRSSKIWQNKVHK